MTGHLRRAVAAAVLLGCVGCDIGGSEPLEVVGTDPPRATPLAIASADDRPTIAPTPTGPVATAPLITRPIAWGVAGRATDVITLVDDAALWTWSDDASTRGWVVTAAAGSAKVNEAAWVQRRSDPPPTVTTSAGEQVDAHPVDVLRLVLDLSAPAEVTVHVDGEPVEVSVRADGTAALPFDAVAVDRVTVTTPAGDTRSVALR